jgi:hypothetical protein
LATSSRIVELLDKHPTTLTAFVVVETHCLTVVRGTSKAGKVHVRTLPFVEVAAG